MQAYNKKIENLLNKVYLSRLSISNYSFYYGNLLKNLNFKLTNEKFHKIIDGDSFYLNEEMIEKENPIKIALFIVDEFEKHMNKISVYNDELRTHSEDLNIDSEDDFSSDNNDGKRKEKKEYWQNKIEETVALLGGEQSIGNIPSNSWIFIDRKKKEKINWKVELRNYIIKDISDYSFSPPDKRYSETDFFLPAFNDETDKLENILFMIDVSGSMKDEIINDVFNEVKNVKEQFRGKVDGFVGWFDTYVRDVKDINDISKIESIKRENVNGTSFVDIFRYKNEELRNIDFKAIIILTDGYGEYPDIKNVGDTPVLWILTNTINKPPFGEMIKYEAKVTN